MINERLSELGGAIIKTQEGKLHVTGFMYPERLEDYYYRNIDCFFSKGIYPLTELDLSVLKDDSLVIIIDDSNNEKMVQFEVLKKDEVKYKTEDKITLKKVYTIRKCRYTNVYNLKFSDESLLFTSKEELQDEFYKRFNVTIEF